MNNKTETNAFSYFFMLFMLIPAACLLITNKMVDGNQLVNTLISIAVSMVLILILFIPTYQLNKKKGCNLIDIATSGSKVFSYCIKSIYCVYFIFASVYFITVYCNFLLEAVNSHATVWQVILLLVIVSVYCGLSGFNVICRCGLVVTVVSVAVNAIVLLSGGTQIDYNNYQPIVHLDITDIVSNIEYLVAVLFILPVCAVLLCKVKGKIKRNFIWWTIGGFGLIAVTVTIAAGAVGNYGNTQSYPVYTLAQISKINILRGIDGMIFSMFTAGVVVILSSFMVCLNKTAISSNSKVAATRFAVIIFIAAGAFFNNSYLQELFFNKQLILCASLITGFVIPLGFALFTKRGHTHEKN